MARWFQNQIDTLNAFLRTCSWACCCSHNNIVVYYCRCMGGTDGYLLVEQEQEINKK